MWGWTGKPIAASPASSPARATILRTVTVESGAARSLMKTNPLPLPARCSARSARISSPESGCTEGSPCLRRATWSRAPAKSIWLHCSPTASETRSAWRYMSKSNAPSRAPFLPLCRAASITAAVSSGVKYSLTRRRPCGVNRGGIGRGDLTTFGSWGMGRRLMEAGGIAGDSLPYMTTMGQKWGNMVREKHPRL